MAFLRKIDRFDWLAIFLFLALFIYWLGCEVSYAHSIQPVGVTNVADFYRHFGQPMSVSKVERNGTTYYKLSGPGPGRFNLAMPSSNPSYIFDLSGRFVEWSADPGDDTPFINKWYDQSNQKIEPELFQKQFGVIPNP